MRFVATLAYWEPVILLGGFFAIVFWKLLTGSISLSQLLCGDRSDNTTYFSPGRVQLLMITLIFALNYLIQVIHDPTRFPDVPNGLVAVLGGSHAVYLGGKAEAMLNLLSKNSNRRSL